MNKVFNSRIVDIFFTHKILFVTTFLIYNFIFFFLFKNDLEKKNIIFKVDYSLFNEIYVEKRFQKELSTGLEKLINSLNYDVIKSKSYDLNINHINFILETNEITTGETKLIQQDLENFFIIFLEKKISRLKELVKIDRNKILLNRYKGDLNNLKQEYLNKIEYLINNPLNSEQFLIDLDHDFLILFNLENFSKEDFLRGELYSLNFFESYKNVKYISDSINLMEKEIMTLNDDIDYEIKKNNLFKINKEYYLVYSTKNIDSFIVKNLKVILFLINIAAMFFFLIVILIIQLRNRS